MEIDRRKFLVLSAITAATAALKASGLWDRMDIQFFPQAQASGKKPESKRFSGVLPDYFPEGVRKWANYIERWSAEYGIDKRQIAAIMTVESRGDQYAVNKNKNGTTDYGLFQVNSTHLKNKNDLINRFDPDTNARIGLGVWKRALNKANGDIKLATRYYNGSIDLTGDDAIPYINYANRVYDLATR